MQIWCVSLLWDKFQQECVCHQFQQERVSSNFNGSECMSVNSSSVQILITFVFPFGKEQWALCMHRPLTARNRECSNKVTKAEIARNGSWLLMDIKEVVQVVSEPWSKKQHQRKKEVDWWYFVAFYYQMHLSIFLPTVVASVVADFACCMTFPTIITL